MANGKQQIDTDCCSEILPGSAALKTELHVHAKLGRVLDKLHLVGTILVVVLWKAVYSTAIQPNGLRPVLSVGRQTALLRCVVEHQPSIRTDETRSETLKVDNLYQKRPKTL